MGQAANAVRKAIKAEQEEQKKQFNDTTESLRQMAEEKMDGYYEDLELVFPLAFLHICSLELVTLVKKYIHIIREAYNYTIVIV